MILQVCCEHVKDVCVNAVKEVSFQLTSPHPITNTSNLLSAHCVAVFDITTLCSICDAKTPTLEICAV